MGTANKQIQLGLDLVLDSQRVGNALAHLASHVRDELMEVCNLAIDIDHMSPIPLGNDWPPPGRC